MTKLTTDLHSVKLLGLLVSIIGTAFSISACSIGIGIYITALVIEIIFQKKIPKEILPFPLLFAVLIGSLLVSVMISDYHNESIRGFFKYIQGFVLLICCRDTLKETRHIHTVIVTILLCTACTWVDALWQERYGVDFIRGQAYHVLRIGYYRLTGPYPHPNDYAIYLIPGLLLIFSLALKSFKNKQGIASASLTALLMIGLYVFYRTNSRGAVISLALGWILMMILKREFKICLIVLGLVIFSSLWMPALVIQRFTSLLDISSGTTPERLLLMKIAWNMIQASPWFGLGLNTYSKNYERFKPEEYEAYMYTHNGYLQLGAESGLIGLGLLLLFIGCIVIMAFKKYAASPSTSNTLFVEFFAATLAILVSGLFESIFQSSQLRTLLWICLGTASACAHQLRNERHA